MTKVLFVSTLILQLAGIAFAAIYVWLNSFSKIEDLEARNPSIIKASKSSMILALIFAFLSCVLTNNGSITEAIKRTTTLFSIIAVSWLLVLVGCGVAMMIAFISPADYKEGLWKSIKQIFSIAIVGAGLGMLFAWLLG